MNEPIEFVAVVVAFAFFDVAGLGRDGFELGALLEAGVDDRRLLLNSFLGLPSTPPLLPLSIKFEG